jgi:hypothetical protein
MSSAPQSRVTTSFLDLTHARMAGGSALGSAVLLAASRTAFSAWKSWSDRAAAARIDGPRSRWR